jgi:hypothetical protein
MVKSSARKPSNKHHITIYATAGESKPGFAVLLEAQGDPVVAFRGQARSLRAAPYRAVLLGLEEAFLRGYRSVTVRSDARLLLPNGIPMTAARLEVGPAVARLAAEVGEFSSCFEAFDLERIPATANPALGLLAATSRRARQTA